MRTFAALRAIAAPLMGFLAMGIFWGVWGALIPAIKAMVGADDRAFGLALLCVALGAVPAMLVGGRLIDRIGPLLLPVSVLLFALAVLLPGLAQTPFALGAALLLVGMGSGLMDVVMNARISAIEAATGRRAMHLAHGLFAAMYLIAAFATGFARSAGIAPLSVLLLAGAAMAGLALLSGMWSGAGQAAAALPETGKPALRRFDGTVMLLGLIVCAAFIAENGWQSWSALFLERELGAEPWLGSAGPAVVGLALAVGRLGGQAVAEQVSDRTMLVGATLLAMTGGLLLALATGPVVALLALFIAASGVSVIAPSALSLAGRLAAPERRGAAVAAVGVIGYTGFFAGPALLGLVADGFGLRLALGALVGVLALVIPLVLLQGRVAGRSVPSADRADQHPGP
ncbi:MFS transporter [Devosia beringensis]|uniref:MFS transporter n=1 Tax=Devosia beringensis TaxID=2657486 RepID=UPI00186BAFCA|nr:MFS transporter [Devosia beringensis]